MYRVKKILAVAILITIASVASFLAQNYIIRERIPPSLGYLILAAGAVILLFFKRFLSNKRERRMHASKRKEAVTWQLEDLLKGLDEQLSLGHITQKEYERKKKKLLEKSKR